MQRAALASRLLANGTLFSQPTNHESRPASAPAGKETGMNLLAQLLQKYEKNEGDVAFIQTFAKTWGDKGDISAEQSTQLEQLISIQHSHREAYAKELVARDEKIAALTTNFETLQKNAEDFKKSATENQQQLEGLVVAAEMSKRTALVDSVVTTMRTKYWPTVVDEFEKYAKMLESSQPIFKYEKPGEGDVKPTEVQETFLEAAVAILSAIPEGALPGAFQKTETSHANPNTITDLERISAALKGREAGYRMQGLSGDDLQKRLDADKAVLASPAK